MSKGAVILTSRDELRNVITPAGTDTFHPVPHFDAVNMAEEEFARAGMHFLPGEKITLYSDGLIMASEIHLNIEDFDDTVVYSPRITITNGNNRQVKFRVAFGLHFRKRQDTFGREVGGPGSDIYFEEVDVFHKHTKNVLRNMPGRIAVIAQEAKLKYAPFIEWMGSLNHVLLDKPTVNDAVVTLMQDGVINSSHIKIVLDTFNEPKYEAYGKGNLFTLHSSNTEDLMTANPVERPQRCIILNERINQLYEEPTRKISLVQLEL